MADPLRVKVEPWGPDPDRAMEIARAALERPAVQAELGGAEARLLTVAPVDVEDPAAAPDRVRATLYDYAAERAVLVDVPLDGAAKPEVTSTVRQPLPTPDERDAAVAILEQHPELGPAIRDERLIPYRAMPPLVNEELPDGTVERTLTVGLQPANGHAGHEIVGVRLGRREVVRFDGGAPPTARASARRCGLPDARQQTTTERPGAARITITKGTETLWKLIAVRPAASAGRDGSGVELRDVSYLGRRVLRRAHVPILNVRYDGDACGPYRDWQNEEGRFKVEDATAPAPGFRLCKKATTILDSNQDQGSFAGVAVFVDGQEVELVSELEAGWYRYVSRWRLHADGRIRARFGFGAVSNSCVCARHHHHAYWRFDFDIGGAADDAVLEFNDPKLPGQDGSWHTLKHEIRRRRNPDRKRRWRVRNRGSGEGYVLVPGQSDGEADSYGVGDFWALRHRPGQIDDAAVADDTRAHLNRFVNGESLLGTNVVVWYAAHFSHDVAHDHSSGGGHIVGPTLVPDRW
jgi:hypothetical protein